MAKPVYGYNKDTDYSKLMQEAAQKGDMARAAIYEAQRNEKIAGEGLNQYQTTNQYASYLPGSYTGSSYKNPYLEELNAAIGRMQDTGAYKKAYLQEADRTMQDVLGQYSTMTGGIPSTQAVAAASQQADYYKSQLGQQLADLDRQNAGLLLSASQQAQSEYQMMISEALDRWTRLGYADDQVAQILGVSVGTPTSDQSYLNWQQGQQAKSDAYTMAMTLLQAGQMPNADTLAAAGITAEDANKLLTAYTKPSYSGGGHYYGGDEEKTGKMLTDRDALASLQEKYNAGGVPAIGQELWLLELEGYDSNLIIEYLEMGKSSGPEEIVGGYQGNGAGAGGVSQYPLTIVRGGLK